MTSLVEVAAYWPRAVGIDEHRDTLGFTDAELRRYRRGFGLSEILFDPAQSEAEILLGAAQKLTGLPGQESRVKYVIRARTVRSPSPYPLSPLQDVRRALGLDAAQTFAVTDAACASGLVAVDLAGMLLSTEPDEEALALVLVGEKAFSRQTQVIPGVAVTGEGTSAVLVKAGGHRDRMVGFAIQTHPIPRSGLVMEKEEYDLFRRVYPGVLQEVIQGALDVAGLRPRDIARLLPHNVNRLSWVRLADALQIPVERMYLDNVARTGHCFCADPFLNYRTATELGLLNPGDYYLMVSVGLGATFSAMVLQH